MLNRSSRARACYAAGISLGMAVVVSGTALAQAPVINKANNTNALNLGTSWVGGVAPVATDIAQWEALVTGANSTLLGADQSWLGLRILNPGGAVTIGGNVLTLGASGIDMSAATQNLTINSGVDLGAAQTWSVGTGRTLTVGGVITDLAAPTSALTKDGAGTLTLTRANTYTGSTRIERGTLNLNFAAAGAPANDILPVSTALVMQNGTTLNVAGSGVLATTQQTILSTQFGDANSGYGRGLTTINVTDADVNSPFTTLNLGTLSTATGTSGATGLSNMGVAVRFVGPAALGPGGAAVPATGRVQVTGTAGFMANTGILGQSAAANVAGSGYATVGLYDFAAVDAADGLIKGGSQLTSGTFYTATATNAAGAGTADNNFDFTTLNAGSVGGGNRFAQSYRFNTPGVNTVNYNASLVHVNGVLVTPNMGAENVTLQAGSTASVFDNTRSEANGQHQTVFWQNNTGGFLNMDIRITNGRDAGPDTNPVGIVKAGQGTLHLVRANNAFSGGTMIYEGAVMFSGSDSGNLGGLGNPNETMGAGVPTVVVNGGALVNNGAAATLAATRGIGIANSATLASTGGNRVAINGVVSDRPGNAGRLTIGMGQIAGTGAGTANATALTGSGIVALGGANTYANGTDITNGATLQATNTTGSATGPGTVNIASTSTLAGTGTVAGMVNPASGGHVAPGIVGTNSGVGTLTLGGLATVGGSILDFDLSVGQNDLIVSSNGFSPALGTQVNLFQAGTAGSFGLNGTYTLFNVTSGSIPSASTLQSNLSIANAAPGGSYTWGVSGNNITLLIQGLANAVNWNLNGGGVWGTAGNWTPAIVPNSPGDSATFGNVLTAGTASIQLQSARTVGNLAFNNTNGASYSIDAAGGSLSMNNNASTAVISAVNGSHSINAPVNLASDTNIAVTNLADTLTITGAVSGAKNINVSGNGKVVMSANNSYANTSIAAGSTLQVGTGGATGTTGSGPITLNGTLDVNRSGAVNLAAISGGGTLVNSGSSVTTLTAANTGAFSTTVGGGSVVVGAGSNLGTGALTTNGGTVDLNGTSATVSSLAGTGGGVNNTNTAPVTLTVNQGGPTTFNGSLNDSGGNLHLVKTGAGALTLSGTTSLGLTTSSYNAGAILVDSSIRVNAGTVILASNGALPAGTVLESRVSGVGVQIGNANIAGTILLHPDSGTSAPVFDVVAGAAATLSGTMTTPPTMTSANAQIRINAGNDANTSLTVTGTLNITNTSSFFFFERGNFVFAGNSQSTIRNDVNLSRGLGGNHSFTFKDNAQFTSTTGHPTATVLSNIVLAAGGGTVPVTAVMTIQDNAVVTSGGGSFELNGAAGTGTTVNLNGGWLNVNVMTKTAASATALNLNGGTIASRATGVLVPATLTAPAPGLNGAVVRAGGAKFEVGPGANSNVDAVLQHEAALAATPDGGLTMSGSGILTLTAANTYAGPTVINGGTLAVNGTHVSNPETAPIADYAVNAGGKLAGMGTIGDGIEIIDVNVNNGGVIAPGDPAFQSTLNVGGNVVFATGGKLEVTLAAGGTSGDKLAVTGNMNLSALSNVLRVQTDAGPALNATWDIATTTGTITGAAVGGGFEAITPGYTAALVGGNTIRVTRTGNSADFDLDGDIDGNDFMVWQQNIGTLGSATQAQGDANFDTNVNAADLAIWKSQFQTSGALIAGAAVPEPGSCVLAASALAVVFGAARRRRGA